MSHHVVTPALIGQSFLVENRLAKQRKFKIRFFSRIAWDFCIFNIWNFWQLRETQFSECSIWCGRVEWASEPRPLRGHSSLEWHHLGSLRKDIRLLRHKGLDTKKWINFHNSDDYYTFLSSNFDTFSNLNFSFVLISVISIILIRCLFCSIPKFYYFRNYSQIFVP